MYPGRRFYFLEIAETKNITRAAERLMVSQPSLTQYLNCLERDLDMKLVDRSFTPLRLTPAGRVYYEYLKNSQELDNQLEQSLKEFRTQEGLSIQVGIPLQKSFDVTANILPVVTEQLPDIRIHIWEGTSNTVRDAIAKGNLEIGFGHTLSSLDENFVIKEIRHEKVLIICNKKNTIFQGKESSMEHPCEINPVLLNSHLFYQMAPSYFLRDVSEAHMKKFQIHPQKMVTISDLLAVVSIISQNSDSGFAYMPDYFLREIHNAALTDSLGFLQVGSEDISWSFSMMHKRNRTLSRCGSAVWNCIARHCCKINT